MKHRLTLLLLLAILSASLSAQCPNDICQDAIYVEEQTPTSFCNYDCNSDFDLPYSPEWNFPNYPCQYLNYDMWFQIEVVTGGFVEFYVGTDYVNETETVIGNNGPLEGVSMGIFSGDQCNSLDFVIGTACYWWSDYDNCCFPVFVPTRQEWNFTVDLEPGTYYVNIDGFGWSVGCGEWWWQEPYFLNLNILESKKKRSKLAGRQFNILGQQIK